MNLQITSIFFCLHYLGGLVAGIPSSHQCSSSNATRSNCQSATCPSSGGCLNVLWAEFKPYAYKTGTDFDGIIPDILEDLLDIGSCCKTCWKLNITNKVSRQSITAGKIDNNIDMVLPYSGKDDEKIQEMEFVSLVQNPAVVYITKKESAGAIPRKLIGAIWNAWPVMIMALLLSVVSGVVLWFLELWQNEEQFPRSFVKGSWEGFWWAFVSMTTVGYGDRVPRSILGRIFSIFWIMIGICICSIFTATLTTALTTITLEEKKTLDRAKVGAIRGSLEAYTAVNHKAKVIIYNSTADLWRALDDEQVEGIILDSYFSATEKISNYIEDNDFRISQTVEEDEKSYGILVRNDSLTKCLRNAYNEVSKDIAEIIADEIESESDENEAAARSDSVFNPTGDVFWPSLYTCIAFVVVMAILGLIWEYFLMGKCMRHWKKGSMIGANADAKNLDQMEQEMIADIQKMFSTWRAQKAGGIGIVGPLKVEDMEQQRNQQFSMK
ncbi:uncharacterized protein LOC114539437 [Dendronephthya gigantea]|uniref:uncharacterized protein LOC114539437 n=1 Tax=Dendronephthya gigantea TaxID=151771 RepID=UPI00106A7305|nr:uncharacterized protein LOC114539437 [Dendronephthya gigantea]XP_028415866.1 uncharacterized protein LOC114539437 [Dendronephthya gigantea]